MYNYNEYVSNNYFRNTMPTKNGQNNLNNTTPSIKLNNQPNLYSPEEGYNRGNLFSNLYVGYKNYKPRDLKATNEQGRLFLELSRYAFAAHELNLYLDLHPEDSTMLTLFNDYRMRANQLMEEYEKRYGPLTVSSDNLSSSFLWESQSFPWEGGNI